MPIRAKRIQYYDDPFFKGIHAAQKGELPFPETSLDKVSLADQAKASGPAPEASPERDNTGQRTTPMDQPVKGQEPMPEGGAGADVSEKAEREPKEPLSVGAASHIPSKGKLPTSGRKRAKAVVHATRDFDDRQAQLDLAVQQSLDLQEPSPEDIAAIEDTEAALAALEVEFESEGQGGVKVTAAE
jgi:type IV secretion system protein VirD4